MDLARERLKQYVRLWIANGALLEEIRDREIRQADTAVSIRALETAFRLAMQTLPLRESSGLVAWQAFMSRWRRHG